MISRWASVGNLTVAMIVFAVAVLTLSSCSSRNNDENAVVTGDGTVETATLSVAPTQIDNSPPVPSPTPTTIVADETPTPTIAGTPVPVVKAVPRQIALTNQLDLASCRVLPKENGAFGTVPIPTATPMPGDRELSVEFINHIYATADLMVANIIELTAQADASWKAAGSDQDRANLIYSEVTRVGHLCGAIPVALFSEQTSDIAASLTTALTTRLEALGSAWDAVGEGRDLSASNELRVDSTDLIKTLPRDLAFYSAKYGATLDRQVMTVKYGGREISVGITVPAEWIVIRNDTQLIAKAPASLQTLNIDDLGPELWDLGVAFRVRRFNTGLLLRRSEPEFVLGGLMSGMGTEISTSEAIIDGSRIFTGEYVIEFSAWRVLAAVLITDEISYLLELGCRAGEWDRCDVLFDELLESFEPE